MAWVPLHVHSQYSILDALASVEGIAEKSRAFQMPAVALTDHGNMYGAVDFYKACKGAGVKPLIGCEVYVAPESRLEKKKEYGVKNAYHLGLIAKNAQGYRNLCKLTSAGFLEGFYYHPRIDKSLLSQHAEGLICLSGCLSSSVSHQALHGTYDALIEEINWFRELFKEDFYLELQRHPMSEEDIKSDGMRAESWLYPQYADYISRQTKVNDLVITASRDLKIKMVATNDSHYLERQDWKAHEILLNIQSGEPCEIWENDALGKPKFKVPNPKRRTYPSHEYYFKSPEQMRLLFNDLPEAIENTLEVAEKCQLELDFKSKHYPVYVPPAIKGKDCSATEQKQAVGDYLWQLCREGIPRRYTPDRLEKIAEIFPGKNPLDVVEERLKYEMEVIVPKGMADYLLIVWDFIHWAKTHGIPMGPGRGSGVGSIVLYLIGVTDIEPLRFHLFFERFINPERISYPDIDVDICMDKRGEVINYVLEKYGKDNIAQIITFGTMKAKMSVKDVGRTLSVPLPKVNEIAKLIPEDLNITLDKALEADPELRRRCTEDEETGKLMEMAKILEGSIRSTGIHAAGVIISGRPLTDLIPVCTAKDSILAVTQYSMKPVEMVGMLKMDFLGLKTLTAIQATADQVKEKTGSLLDWVNLPLDDKAAFDLLNQGKTLGVFQLESGGMQDLARQLHLDCFEEIIAVGALYRPGPMQMIPSFIDRKHGREAIENDHPWLKEILAETYGIMVYQEQVMQIASKLANFSLGEGDVLRRAMGKKDLEQMSQQREKFKKGALNNGIDEETSMRIFDKMEKFASYGFNKSHAAAYGFLSYVTAYLKANYPKEWMAALMTCDSHDISKVAKFIREAHHMGISVLPPDINEAGTSFLATAQGIRFGMAGIKGVGDGVVEAVINERRKNGAFKNLFDFVDRLDLKKMGKKTIESLIEAGSFDFTGWSRDQLIASVEPIYEHVVQQHKEKALGYVSLFSLMEQSPDRRFQEPQKVAHPKTHLQHLMKEKELLGFFLTGHPMDSYKHLLDRLSCQPFSKGLTFPHDAVFRSAFIVESATVRLSAKTQKKFAILMVSDGEESIELPVWSDLYEQKLTLFQENKLLYAVLQVDKREETPKFSCKWIEDLTQADEKMIQDCDAAFDKAKSYAQRPQYKNATSTPKSPSAVVAPPEAKPKKVHLKLDLAKVRLSQILALRDLFSYHRGSAPVFIECFADSKFYAKLHIESNWGVNATEAFEADLLKLNDIERVL